MTTTKTELCCLEVAMAAGMEPSNQRIFPSISRFGYFLCDSCRFTSILLDQLETCNLITEVTYNKRDMEYVVFFYVA